MKRTKKFNFPGFFIQIDVKSIFVYRCMKYTRIDDSRFFFFKFNNLRKNASTIDTLRIKKILSTITNFYNCQLQIIIRIQNRNLIKKKIWIKWSNFWSANIEFHYTIINSESIKIEIESVTIIWKFSLVNI